MPKADLVSAFSFAMQADYPIGKKDCDAGGHPAQPGPAALPDDDVDMVTNALLR